MSFETTWINDPHIICTHYIGRASSRDLMQSATQYLEMLRTQELYIVLDFSQSEGVPHAVMNMPLLLQIITHANTKWLTIVNPSGENSYTARLLVRDKVKVYRDLPTALGFMRGMVRMDTGEILAKNS